MNNKHLFNLKTLGFLIPVFLFLSGPLKAGTLEADRQSDSLIVYFEKHRTSFSPTSEIDGFIQSVKDALEIGGKVQVEVRAYACPSGLYDNLQKVARKRAQSLADFIIRRTGLSKSNVTVVETGIGWNILLCKTSTDSNVPGQAKAIDVLQNTPEFIRDNSGNIVGGKKQQLMNLEGGRTYNYLSEHYFPQARIAVAYLVTDAQTAAALHSAQGSDGAQGMDVYNEGLAGTEGSNATETSVSAESTDAAEGAASVDGTDGAEGTSSAEGTDAAEGATSTESTDIAEGTDAAESAASAEGTDAAEGTETSRSLGSVAGEPEVEPEIDAPRFLLKTNIPYWAIMVPNLAVEIRLADHWSLDIPAFYSPFTTHNSYRFRTLNFQPGLRYWLRSGMTGHFFGVHAIGGIFNIAVNDTHRYQDIDGAWGGGIDYGYALSFSKHWGMEFNIGVGYLWSRYEVFYNIENGASHTTDVLNYWGITRVGISLIYKL